MYAQHARECTHVGIHSIDTVYAQTYTINIERKILNVEKPMTTHTLRIDSLYFVFDKDIDQLTDTQKNHCVSSLLLPLSETAASPCMVLA